jgi:hypothetical protein
MPQNITGTNVNTSPIVVPDNGDPVDGAGLALASQGLANVDTYIKDKIMGLSTDRYFSIPLVPIYNGSNIWVQTLDFAGMPIWQQSTAAGGELMFPVPCVPWGFLKEAHINLSGLAGTHGAMPAVKPRLRIWQRPNTQLLGADPILLSSIQSTTTDSAASVPAYEVIHTISKTGLSLSLDYPTVYLIDLIGESSTNAVANGLVLTNIIIKVGP